MAMTHEEMLAVIQAHKEGKGVQVRLVNSVDWEDVQVPLWNFHTYAYRIKPEPKPDIVRYGNLSAHDPAWLSYSIEMPGCNIRLIFDGETGKLKSAEVL